MRHWFRHPHRFRTGHSLGHHGRMRHSLQRRLFLWFGMTIVLTGLAVGGVFALFGPGGSHFFRGMDAAKELVSDQFARVWSNPAERHSLTLRVGRVFDADVTLEDAKGRVIGGVGPPCRHSAIEVRVSGSEGLLGFVRGCPRRHPPRPFTFVLALVAAGGTLWLASAAISMRLGRPLAELVRVTREIGAGKLTARVRLGRHHSGEVGVLAESVNDMAGRIEAQMRSQRELLAIVSHEIRSPLARLRILVELARSGQDAEKVLSDIDGEIVQVDELVGKLLASSRLDFDALTLKAVTARETAERALEATGNPETLLTDESHGALLEADPTLLGRALSNVLENAKSHGAGADRFTLRLEPVGGVSHVVFEVVDRGPGFSEADLPRVFEPFYRSGDRGHGALGLGLSLVDRIARAHGGSAFAHNRAGGGGVVGIKIPVREP